MNVKLKSRKFWIFMGLTALAIVMTTAKVLDGDQFVDMIMFVWGGYVAGNVGEHFSTRK